MPIFILGWLPLPSSRLVKCISNVHFPLIGRFSVSEVMQEASWWRGRREAVLDFKNLEPKIRLLLRQMTPKFLLTTRIFVSFLGLPSTGTVLLPSDSNTNVLAPEAPIAMMSMNLFDA